jgi:type I restriction enzyme S subunit
MTLVSYGKLQDTGVKWLGDVPAHWKVGRFRNHFQESPEKIDKEIVGVMLSVSGYRGIEIKEYDDENRRRLDEELVNYRIVRVGQLVVNSMWLNAAGLGVSAFEGHVSPAYRCYWIGKGLNLRYVHHLMRSAVYVDAYTSMAQGIRPNSLQLSRTDLMNLPVLIPPLDEQHAISSFLDEETSKIDGLVSDQRRLIELLKEKRQAVISHAVTKGLNPNAPMKPSGIQWLGDVPEHWEIGRLNHLVDARKGIAFKADDFIDEGVDVVKASDIKELTIRTPSTFLPKEFVIEYPKAVLHASELVLSTVGSNPEMLNSAVGQLGRVPENLAGSLLNQNTVVFSPNEETLTNHFLYYLIQTTGYRDHLDLHAHGTANQASLNVADMLHFQIPLPEPTEQVEIADYLDRKMSMMDDLSAEAERAIELLQERRTALISAAVTGKIDVHNFEPEEAA